MTNTIQPTMHSKPSTRDQKGNFFKSFIEPLFIIFLSVNGVILESAPIRGNIATFDSQNSVNFDKNFIDKYMPKISEYLHYRILDVSSIAILFNNTNI